MKRKNMARNALFTSILSLLLCVSMLVGTTFAWFSDSVASSNNIIVAGNLDIELEYSKDGNNWNTVAGATSLFTDELWEPGHTDVVYLKLTNKGTLALNYQLGINIASETEGTNVAGNAFKLSDYIQFGVVEDQSTKFADRAAAVDAVKGSSKKLNEGYSKANEMLPGAEAYMAVVVYMPETVGNEANYRGGVAPQIDLGINVVATQKVHESDSFDNTYDENADTSAAGLPMANVTAYTETSNIEWTRYGDYYPTEGLDANLEAAYTFSCIDTPEAAAASDYANWYCDFYVKLNKPLGENQIFLGGNYGSFGWVGFHNGTYTLAANEEIGLLSSVTTKPWTYKDVAASVGTFTCGVGDVNNALSGATFTVMLRLTNPENANEYYNVATINYTFQ